MNRSRRTRDRRRAAGPSPRGALVLSSDDRLVELALDGDAGAFELLYERHVDDALWLARELLGSQEEAQEAVRHSFAAAHAYFARDDGREISFAPWLHTIIANHCLTMLQERRDDAAAQVATVVDLDEWRRRRGRLRAALPFAPSAGLQESVMAAWGIGGGATAAGGSLVGGTLLGGTLAKVAAVVVLAGGVGVAGNVAAQRDAPASSGVDATGQVAAGEGRGVERVATLPPPGDRRTSPDTPGGDPRNAGEPAGNVGGGAVPDGAVPLDGGTASPRLPAPTGGPVPARLLEPAGIVPSPALGDGGRVERGLPIQVELPDVQLPDEVTAPGVTLPKVTLPKVALPKVEVPDRGLPRVKLPPVKLPKVKLPKVKLPRVNVPSPVHAEPPPAVEEEDGGTAKPSPAERRGPPPHANGGAPAA